MDDPKNDARRPRSSHRGCPTWTWRLRAVGCCASLCVLAAVGAGSPVAAQEPTSGQNLPAAFVPPAAWLAPFEPFAIAEGLYYVGSQELASYLLTTSEGHVLIDVPMAENAGMILGNVRQLGFDPADIRIVLATHGHFDHTGGVAEVLAATGADLLLSPLEATLVAAGGRGDFFLGDRAGYPPAQAPRILSDGEVVRLGELQLRAEFTPGHTRGCTSWSFEIQVAGQPARAVLTCSLSVLDGYQLVGERSSYPGIGADFCRSVARLEALEAKLFLANHGVFIDLPGKRRALSEGDASAFIDPEGYRDYLAGARRRIEETLQAQGGVGCGELLAAERP